MKNTLTFFLLAVIVVASGCLNNKNTSPPVPVPTGTFSGQFTSLHLRSTGKTDTSKAAIQLTTTANGLFKVSGDTSTVHAGSHGSFGLNSVYVQFQDSTVSASVPYPAKVHLNGVYQYYYDGTTFQIAAGNDTLSYKYNLTRTN